MSPAPPQVRGRGLVHTHSVEAGSQDAQRIRQLFGGGGGGAAGAPSASALAAFASDAALHRSSSTYNPAMLRSAGHASGGGPGSSGSGEAPSCAGSYAGSEVDAYDVGFASAPPGTFADVAASRFLDAAEYGRAQTLFLLAAYGAMTPTLAYTLLSWPHRRRYTLPSTVAAAAYALLLLGFTARGVLPPVLRRAMKRQWPLACLIVHALVVASLVLATLDAYLQERPGGRGPAATVRSYFWNVHLLCTGLIAWVISQQARRGGGGGGGWAGGTRLRAPRVRAPPPTLTLARPLPPSPPVPVQPAAAHRVRGRVPALRLVRGRRRARRG